MGEGKAGSTILIADDDLHILGLLRNYFRQRGFEVLEAADGDQAIELTLAHRPNLVILDVMMPGQSGWEVCRSIRENDALAATGVVMLTGIGRQLNELTSPLYGADAYLDKPFSLDDLERAVGNVLAKRVQPAGRA